jgi:hypothetical protein
MELEQAATRGSSRGRMVGSTALSPECDRELRGAIDDTLDRYPHNGKDDWQLGIYYRDLVALVMECGLERVKAALARCWTHCKFFPEPAEVREYLPAPKAALSACDESCARCRGTGWELVEVKSTLLAGKIERRAQRCGGSGKKSQVGQPGPGATQTERRTA